MQEKIFKDLEKLGHRFSKIETELEMPKNYLSRFKNIENKLPEKWVQPLQNYLLKYTIVKDDAPKIYDAPPVDLEKSNDELPQFQKTKLVVEETGLKEKPSDAAMDRIRKMNVELNKRFGEGTVMIFGDKPDKEYKTISTGSLLLNRALGIGGFPRGRMVEIFGLESSGKTTIALCAIADAQKQGLKCLLIDAENSFDPEYAEILGVKVDELDYCQPSYGEQGLEVADSKILTGEYGCVVIDSVAALVPKGELEGEMGDSRLGLHARLMSQACRKMTGSVAKSNTLLIFINQIRNKIGVQYGSPEVTTGGLALQFYASIRLRVSRSTTNENSITNGDGIKEGNQTTVKVIKNKCAPPFRQAVFYIIYAQGIDSLSEIVDLAIEENIIVKSGSWYSYDGNKLGQGKENIKALLHDNEDLKNEITEKINIKTS